MQLFVLSFSLQLAPIFKKYYEHMTDNGPVPRAHGDNGKGMPHGLVFDDMKAAVQFIVNYAVINGLPQPALPSGTDNTPPVYLHCSNTKKVSAQRIPRFPR